jgi:short-subunit dehydrogenase involved in D-alanine esterification of teichoic acids
VAALLQNAFPTEVLRSPHRLIYNTSVLAYVPLAMTAVYSSTKAALHSYVLSQRYNLKNTTVSVLEIAPPWVQTDLMGSNNEPRAMLLDEFINETIDVLGTDAHRTSWWSGRSLSATTRVQTKGRL